MTNRLRMAARAQLAMALLAGCSGEETAAPSPPLEGDLTLEIRDQLAITIDPARGEGPMQVRLTPSAGYGLLEAGRELGASGRIATLPEAGGTLYTVRLDSAPVAGGRCGTEPVSLALSLYRQRDNATVMGGLAAYCGAGQWHGVPKQILRIAGELPLPE